MKLVTLALGLALSTAAQQHPLPTPPPAPTGTDAGSLFVGTTDIGITQPGSSVYNPTSRTYTLGGGGADVWGAADDFRFTWVHLDPGDASLTADLHVAQPSTDHLAKGMLMFRQSLDPGSPYADVALHADGHITLQYRLTPGGETKDVVLPEHNASRLRLARRGDHFTASAISPGGAATASPPGIDIPLRGSLYIGLGVCSHSTTTLQTVTFTDIHLQPIP